MVSKRVSDGICMHWWIKLCMEGSRLHLFSPIGLTGNQLGLFKNMFSSTNDSKIWRMCLFSGLIGSGLILLYPVLCQIIPWLICDPVWLFCVVVLLALHANTLSFFLLTFAFMYKYNGIICCLFACDRYFVHVNHICAILYKQRGSLFHGALCLFFYLSIVCL